MSLRTARFSDLPGLIDFIEARWHESKLAAYPMNEERLAYLLAMCIQRHGRDLFLMVTERDGIVTGLLAGGLQPIYLVSDALEATDYVWVTGAGAGPRDGARLLTEFHRWAMRMGVSRIRQGVMDTMGSIHPAAVRMLEHKGFRLVGGTYEKEIEP